MRKLGGILAIAVLALTACSAPVEATPQPFVGSAPSPTTSATAETITAAPIQPQAAPEETPVALRGEFGNPATDAAFLDLMKEKWAGDLPTDAELIGAAKFACEELAAGKDYNHIDAVKESPDNEYAKFNSINISGYASVFYCTEYDTMS